MKQKENGVTENKRTTQWVEWYERKPNGKKQEKPAISISYGN